MLEDKLGYVVELYQRERGVSWNSLDMLKVLVREMI